MGDKLNREELRKFLPSHRAVVAWEQGVDDTDAAQQAADDAQSAANAAQASANAAQAAADAAQAAADAAQAAANVAQAAITAHAAATTAHGVTGNVVGTQGAQVLQDKTLDGTTPLTGRTLSTGAAAAVLTANKPGATTAISTWLTMRINGTDYVIPLYLPT